MPWLFWLQQFERDSSLCGESAYHSQIDGAVFTAQ